MTSDDRRLLGLTLDLARKGTGRTCPNPLVGALIVKDGAIVGQGYHRRAGDEHAETVALREAGARARGAVLYVSLEPCSSHRLLHGRTSPCVDQILEAGIARVVAAARDPNPAIDGRGLRRLSEAGVAVEEADPVLGARAARLNEIFFAWVGRRSPFVALKAGMSLDGRIALPSGESKWITGEQARGHARGLRDRYSCVLVGIGTVLADDPELGAAPSGPEDLAPDPASASAARPTRVVLDSRLRMPLSSKLVAAASARPLIVYASDAAERARQGELEARGVVVVRAGAERVSIAAVLADLAARELTSVLVEGGGSVLGSFLAEGLADKLYLFIAPRLLRGQDALAAFGGAAPGSLAESLDLDIAEIRDAGGDLMIEAYPRK